MSDELRLMVVEHLLPSVRSPEEGSGIDRIDHFASVLVSANDGYAKYVSRAFGRMTGPVYEAFKCEVTAVNNMRRNQGLRKWRAPFLVGWPMLTTLCLLREIVSDFRTVVACQSLIRALRVDPDAPPNQDVNEIIELHFLNSVYLYHTTIREASIASNQFEYDFE